jgi:hypothetical protein
VNWWINIKNEKRVVNMEYFIAILLSIAAVCGIIAGGGALIVAFWLEKYNPPNCRGCVVSFILVLIGLAVATVPTIYAIRGYRQLCGIYAL